MIVQRSKPLVLWRAGAVLIVAVALERSGLAEDSIEPGFLTGIRQVTSGFVRAGEGYFSPDGDEIVYQAVPQDYPFYQIFFQSLAGSVPRRISTGEGRTTCAAFNPDDKHLIFASSHLDPNLGATEQAERDRQAEDARTGKHRRYQWDFDPYMDIFASDLQGHELRQLTHEKGYDAEGSFSPDGKQIVFCSDRDGDPDVYLMNADGSNVRQLTDVPGYDGGPFFSPDGRWIIYRSDRKREGFLQIHVIERERRVGRGLDRQCGRQLGPLLAPEPALRHLDGGRSFRSLGPAKLRSVAAALRDRGGAAAAGGRADPRHRSFGGRRLARLFARRQETDVDQQSHGRPL